VPYLSTSKFPPECDVVTISVNFDSHNSRACRIADDIIAIRIAYFSSRGADHCAGIQWLNKSDKKNRGNNGGKYGNKLNLPEK
jgi:hypothetical protein